MDMENEKPKSKYGQWIIGTMLVAYLATSFDYRYFSLQSPIVTIGDRKIGRDKFVQRIREEKAYVQMMLYPPQQKMGDMYFMNKVVLDDIWDQEALSMGIDVSENRARQSLRQKLCFLDASGRLDRGRLLAFYKKNPMFFEPDWKASEESGGFLMAETVHSPLYRGNNVMLDAQDRFDEGRMNVFLRNNGVSLLQMIAAEQRNLRRLILKNALAKNITLPPFYKEMAEKGRNQERSWRSQFFPMNSVSEESVSVSSKEVQKSIEKGLPQWMMECPEMRTFTVMMTPNFGTLAPIFDKNGVRINKQTEIEDVLGSGKQLGDVAKEHRYACATLTSSAMAKSIDFSPIAWKQANGEALRLPEDMQKRILQRVFSEKEGVYTLPFAMGGMIWIQVQTIQPKRFLNAKEREAAAEYFLKIQKRDEQVALKARAFEKTLGRKKAAQKGMTLYTAHAQDNRPPEGVSPEVMARVFEMTPPDVTDVIQTPAGYEVVSLVSVVSKKPDSEIGNVESEKVGVVLDRQWRAAFLQAYERGLRKKYTIVVNEQAFQSEFGGGVAEQEDSFDDEE